MVVIGATIGSGIFINPYIVAQRLGSGGPVLTAWVVGGAIALTGALAYAELGVLVPRAGGHYAYLRDAYHPLAGFLYGWALLLVIESGAIAIQSGWAAVLTLTGTYAQLLDYVVFADWIFLGLAVGSVFIFRRRVPLSARTTGSFAASGYPILPALFVATAVGVVVSAIWASRVQSALGAALLACGIPVYWFSQRGVRDAGGRAGRAPTPGM
jgi:APA family basic amino acid/polyamine antiporter